ncbi:serine hydrolase domain-containing protein [Saccharibacillus alkalitolerans]|uniref:Beta-lactamase family protein n=1 Tax=Saccharibacillus alkalitolerans TaxID=2705290 RepID=A0ABX0FCC5_9BACL|nr:serine hydrolase domain-containing protein [Saccharibacillus alkalitolerans]NGZ77953.1 beta-lactamase family protein [Saccharibacillus alkalitolerans]
MNRSNKRKDRWKKGSAAAMAAVLLALPIAEGRGAARGAEAPASAAAEKADPAAAARSEAPNAARVKAQAMVDALIQNYGVTGAQYAIRDKGKIVLSGGTTLDDNGGKREIGKTSMFGVGSVSKMYVTAAAMMLADDGKIEIDRPLTEYIPDFKMTDERYKEITPRMLMNHSAGLYGSHYKNSMLLGDNDSQNYDSLLANLSVQRLKSDPGEYSVYANDGFQLLELLVERVSGMDYSEFLRQRVGDPLKLNFTRTPMDEFDRGALEPIRLPGMPKALPPENANILGTGGVYSNAEELTLFGDVLTGEHPELLSEQSVEAMLQPEYRKGVWVPETKNAFGYGLGWDSVDLDPFGEYGIRAATKGGDTIMYHSALISLPDDDISIAFLTSGGSSLYNTAAATDVLLEYLKQSGKIANVLPAPTYKKPVKTDMPADMKKYAGLYGTVGETRRISLNDGETKMPAMMSGMIPEQTYVYTGSGEFTSEDGRTVLAFDEQTNGHTYLRVRSDIEMEGIGGTRMAFYEAQKLDDNRLEKGAAAAWSKRDGKTYYALDEKINSLFYISPSILTKKIAFEKEGGYANGTKIVDKDHAVNAAEIPVMNGRDTFDLTFTRQGGVEYLQADGRTYVSEDGIGPLYAGRSSVVTIPASGSVRWFKIPAAAAGKTLTSDFPEGAGFAVYDKTGAPVEISAASGSKTAVLPEGGLVVFGGKAGDALKVKLERK